jgi:hypothetical protein
MNYLKKLGGAAAGTATQPAKAAAAADLSDPKVLFDQKRAGMLKLINE